MIFKINTEKCVGCGSCTSSGGTEIVDGKAKIINQEKVDKELCPMDAIEIASIEEVIGFYEYYAKENGLKLNPNRKIVESIVKSLMNRHGYCPCRIITEDKEENKKIICPCFYHKDEIKKDGHCHCNLFVK